MTPRERILTAFQHEKPDHTPTDAWFHDVVVERLKEHYKTDEWDDVLQALGIEGWKSLSPWLLFPEFSEKATERPNGKDGPRAIWIDERTYQDAMGVTHRFGDGDWYQERVAGPLEKAETVDDILAHPFPSVDQIQDPDDYAGQVEALKKQDLFVSGDISNPYKTAWMLRGMENILMDYLVNPDVLNALYGKLYEVEMERTLRMARAGVDMIKVTGDIAMQDRIVMGPEAWREFDKPRLAELIQNCRAVNPDVYFYIHSDGNVMDLMDDLVEIGFNVINPIQPECMDPVEVKKRWGDKITMHGGVSLQRTLPNGTVEDVRAEIEHLIETCGYNGGLVVFPSNVIQPDTPTENIIACFHAARDFPL